ncbi:hypothetical protein Z517_05179 [Fonsecaea pedrosoi CBS 271.37]|uniref:Lariat debranching enzyme C-terminal domain-containing protein n=1 Tax=Fonsecaea pedrosoi CBS 271.37 TaxID=1442368 RepID=A0A0D2F649_9EURO|nr:uncharacterized protein Z517_05179 [Fonsecaea pedrosoi CBS 271.37]KIW82152.1 hypothetical protein Z517_05179 [Fonsecaea pedrosoi CBS 271.37]
MSVAEEEKKSGVRVAVEGCGHGTLHAIYASVEESCRVKGWDGVDLLIIGGDFQAVRNQHDLNVTAMPVKYRRMADFHEYYSGTRTAPYLTIFIGGNHEASNHLFELYYGGWVAPNIYYLGAANVIRLGPLRIAGLTGIWKGYDYRKPHFERLPYNQEDINSIYHVREIDVRKLLSLRSQVDIGLSHDWPQGVEHHGDYKWLFRKRRDFEADSSVGKLGSAAARQCLDRLRPPYWFSAHLHTKYAAVYSHEESEVSQHGSSRSAGGFIEELSGNVTPRPEDRQQVSAWQQFQDPAQQDDAEQRATISEDQETKLQQEGQPGAASTPQYSYDETFNKIGRENGLERTVLMTSRSRFSSEDPDPIPNLDGCFYSRPSKRQRVETGPSDPASDLPSTENRADTTGDQLDGAKASVPEPVKPVVANPDAIDIDMSDDDESTTVAIEDTAASRSKPLQISRETAKNADIDTVKKHDTSHSLSEESEDGGVKLTTPSSPFTPMPSISSLRHEVHSSHDSIESSTTLSDAEQKPPSAPFDPQPLPSRSAGGFSEQSHSGKKPDTEPQVVQSNDDVPQEIKDQLAALSHNFVKKAPVEVSAPLPFPEDITNKTTYFLALGKCEMYQEFLQLLEIQSITSEEEIKRPLKLSYDPEWLAIQRVFASELQLGGSPKDRVPQHRGDTYYRDRITEEQEWVTEHVVKPGKLQVPENFSVTAPLYDPRLQVAPEEMPREVTNPQTSTYCDLIGIENKFDMSEQERDSRVQQGPRPESSEFQAYHSRPRQHGQGGGRGRGNHRRGGGGGGNRGRGRGRGRGRRL